jgi:hypothetical protein
MTNQLTSIVANERAADLRRAATQYRRAMAKQAQAGPRDAEVTRPIILRLAGEQDAAALRELAELDDAAPLTGPVLLALVGGEVISALSLEDGSVAANPFVLTDDAVTLLRVRAEHLSGSSRRRRWRVLPRLRLA